MFTEPFPELKARAPVLPGQTFQDSHVTILGKTINLDELRRQQLTDLARAWRIPVKTGATKRDLLPTLVAAAQSGIFNGPPADEWWLRKAGRSPDQRGVILPGLPKDEGPAAAPAAPAPVETIETHYEDPRPIWKQHIGVIRRKAKEAGMKLDKKTTKDEMLVYLGVAVEVPDAQS